MKKEVVDGQELTVFDDLEEMKWYYHGRLCNSSSIRDEDRMRNLHQQHVAELMIYWANKSKTAAIVIDPMTFDYTYGGTFKKPIVKTNEADKEIIAEVNKLFSCFDEPCMVRVIG